MVDMTIWISTHCSSSSYLRVSPLCCTPSCPSRSIAARRISYDVVVDVIICVCQETHSVLAGTTAGDLFEVFIGTLRAYGESDPKVIRELVRSHAGAAGGVAPFPAGFRDGDGFATVGADGSIRIWAANRKRMARARCTGSPAAAIDCRKDGAMIAVGHAGGGLTIWETRWADTPEGLCVNYALYRTLSRSALLGDGMTSVARIMEDRIAKR
jgi:hypothetical protein